MLRGYFYLLKPRNPHLKNVQLHAVQLVKFEVFKSKIHVLSSWVALLSFKSLEKKAAPQKLWILQHQKPRRTEN